MANQFLDLPDEILLEIFGWSLIPWEAVVCKKFNRMSKSLKLKRINRLRKRYKIRYEELSFAIMRGTKLILSPQYSRFVDWRPVIKYAIFTNDIKVLEWGYNKLYDDVAMIYKLCEVDCPYKNRGINWDGCLNYLARAGNLQLITTILDKAVGSSYIKNIAIYKIAKNALKFGHFDIWETMHNKYPKILENYANILCVVAGRACNFDQIQRLLNTYYQFSEHVDDIWMSILFQNWKYKNKHKLENNVDESVKIRFDKGILLEQEYDIEKILSNIDNLTKKEIAKYWEGRKNHKYDFNNISIIKKGIKNNDIVDDILGLVLDITYKRGHFELFWQALQITGKYYRFMFSRHTHILLFDMFAQKIKLDNDELNYSLGFNTLIENFNIKITI
ncbi:MAG: F-box protein [Acidimicrobiales bacterium]